MCDWVLANEIEVEVGVWHFRKCPCRERAALAQPFFFLGGWNGDSMAGAHAATLDYEVEALC